MNTEQAYSILENRRASVKDVHIAQNHLILLLGEQKYIKVKMYYRSDEVVDDDDFSASGEYTSTKIPRTIVEKVREYLEIRGSATSRQVATWIMISHKHATSLMSGRPEFVFCRGTGKWSLRYG